MAQLVKNQPAMQETCVQSCGSILGFNPGVQSWRMEMLPTPVFWPGEFHGLYSPWGHRDLDTTERLSFTLHLPDKYKVLSIN